MDTYITYQSHSSHDCQAKHSTYLCTIRFVKRIFVLLAGCLLTLHSLTPHQHEKAQESDVEGQGVLGFLVEQFGDIFGQDLGAGHLEDYTYSQKSQDGLNEEIPAPSFMSLLFVLVSLDTEALSSQRLAAYIPISESVLSACSSAELPSRAPPVLA